MYSITHDPAEYIKGIQQILISDKKKIAFLFGAGTSSLSRENKSLTIPAIGEMTYIVVRDIGDIEPKYKIALDEIKEELGEMKYNIENILSNIEQKYEVIGSGTLNKLNKAEFEGLKKLLKEKIRALVSIHKNINEANITKLVHTAFAEWVGKADRRCGVEIFTTNYDYLFEIGLEYNDIPYYDGFSGSYEPFFNPESVEDICFVSSRTKLWKMHGSLGWHFKESSKRIVREHSDKDDLLIYPSMLKYNNSKKQPYVSFMDRLSNFIKQDDSVLLTCGYSFNDEHINGIILSALKTNTTSHVLVLYYDEVRKKDGEKEYREYLLKPDSPLYELIKSQKKISVYGMRSAVIGGKYGEWKLRTEPDKDDTININLYFDEDGPENDTVEKMVEKKGDEIWTGEGRLILPDFSKLVNFLKSMVIQNEIREIAKNVSK
jgi:hypothetical protein